MRWLKLYSLFVLTLPVALCCRQAQAQTPQISVGVHNDTVDVCGNKRSLIVVYVDYITRQDSILGYEIELRYDPEKLYLTDELFLGTLTEQFEDHKLTFPEPGVARGWALNVLQPVATFQTDQPLIAMAGQFLGNCTDTVHVDITAVSFSHVRNLDVVDIDGIVERQGLVAGAIEDRADRHVSTVLQPENIQLHDVDTSGPVTVSLQNAGGKGIDTIEVELMVTNLQQFTLQDIAAADHVVIDGIDRTDDTWNVRLAVAEEWSGGALMTFWTATIGNKNDTGTVVVRPVQVNECACVTRLSGSSVELHSTEEVQVAVHEAEKPSPVEVIGTERGWYVRNIEKTVRYLRIVTVTGQDVMTVRIDDQQSVFINAAGCARGVYLMMIGTDRTKQTMIITK